MRGSPGSKRRGRDVDTITGPRECPSLLPTLHSYQGENCSADGVACMGGGPGAWEGVAYLGGKPVCRDGWGRAEAGVFCRMMGFRDGFEEEESDIMVKGPFGMNHVTCKGTEKSLADCNYESPVTDCTVWEGAGVKCEQFDEHPGTAAPPHVEQDCSVICLKDDRYGLPNQGNLWVRNKPVCDDDWGVEEAEVVCRQLGFPGFVNYTKVNKFGPINTGRFSMDNVRCQGSESDIMDCRHSSSDDCSDEEGAGVICIARPPTTPSPSPTPASSSSDTCEVKVFSGQWANSEADEQFHMRNILYDECDSFSYFPPKATYWLAPAETQAQVILDLGCNRVVDKLTLKNTRNAQVNNRGLKRFSFSISNSTQGPWRVFFNGTLEDARGLSNSFGKCDVSLSTYSLGHLPEDQRTGQALRLDAISWYGRGAGLQYLKIHSHSPTGPLVTVVVLVLLFALVLGLGAFVWSGREQLIARFQPNKDGGGGGVGHRVGFRPGFKTQQSRQALIEQNSLPTGDDTKEQNNQI